MIVLILSILMPLQVAAEVLLSVSPCPEEMAMAMDTDIGESMPCCPDEAFFWATHQGAELDLLMLRGQQRIGVFPVRQVQHSIKAFALRLMEQGNLESALRQLLRADTRDDGWYALQGHTMRKKVNS